MACKGVAELAVGEIPHLNGAIPGPGHDGRSKSIRAESNAGNPIGVGVSVLDGVFALTEGVPETDGAITRGGDDLTVVDREGDGEDVLGVADEAAGGGAGAEVPEAELAVPGTGEGKLAVGAEDNILDEVGVAGEAATGNAVGGGRGVDAGLLGEVPDEDGFVAGGGDDHVRVVDGGGDGGDPVGVAAHGTAMDEHLRHCWW